MRSELQAKPARGRERPQGEHAEARPSKHQLRLTKKGNLGAEIHLSAIGGFNILCGRSGARPHVWF